MISNKLWAGITTIAAIAAATVAVETRYQKASAAESQHEYLASSNETGRLETELKLIELEIRQLRALKETRELSDEENDRESYLKERRKIITERLTEITTAA